MTTYHSFITITYIQMEIRYIPTVIKDTTESSMSAFYLDFVLNRDINGKLNTKLYDKWDDFNFSIFNSQIFVTIYQHHVHMA